MQVVIIGANGAVGNAAVELAKMQKAQVLGLVRNAANLAGVQQQGIQADVLPSDANDADALKKLIRTYFSEGADIIFDTTGYWIANSIGSIAKYGKVAVIVAPGNGQVNVSIRDLYRNGGSIVG
jgi:NADPH:quinone reductase-like Zn-dependent oxidoreductase